MKDKSYFRYWGKTDRNDPTLYHLLAYHCLDVAAVGWVLMNPKDSQHQRLTAHLRVEPTWLRDFFTFCIALHDIGKFSRAFQGLQPDISPDLVKSNPRMQYSERHDTLGFWLWRKCLSTQLEKTASCNGKWLTKIEPWMEIVTGHHGMPPKKSGGRFSNFFNQEDENAACHFALDAYNLFLTEFDHAHLLDKELKSRLKVSYSEDLKQDVR